MEIEIRREALLAVAVIVALALFGTLGYEVSPRDRLGRPVLLLPDAQAAERYRRSASRWTVEWRTLDSSLRDVLATDDGAELLATSRNAQRAFEQAVAIAQAVDGSETPSPLMGLRDQVTAAAKAYVDASAAVARLVSAPSTENRTAAEETVAEAGRKLALLEANEWVRTTGGE